MKNNGCGNQLLVNTPNVLPRLVLIWLLIFSRNRVAILIKILLHKLNVRRVKT